MKYKTTQYETTVQACTFLYPLQSLQSRFPPFCQLLCLFQCGNAHNSMNINGRWYSLENKQYVDTTKLTQRTIYKGRNMNLCSSLSMGVNAYLFFPWPKYITRQKISHNCMAAAKRFMVFPGNSFIYTL